MNLNSPKVTQEEKVDLCKKYFYLGWLLFPFAWAVNAIWFYPEAFRKPEFQVSFNKLKIQSLEKIFLFQGQKTIKTLVIMSGIGSLIWLVGIITWMSIFTTRRAEWGAVADYMSFNIPLGIP